MEDFKELIFEVDGEIATITLNRPQHLNAFGKVLIDESAKVTDLLTHMKDIRVVIVTGSGGNFCSGLDIIDMSEVEESEGLRLLRAVARVLETTFKSRKITIAAVEGYCLGGGLNLALSCDILVSSEKAVFGQPEVNFSYLPGIIRVWRHAGMNRAKYMALTGELFPAKEVAEWGLISKMVPEGEALTDARNIAEKLIEKPDRSLKTIKMLFTEVMDLGFHDAALKEKDGFLELFKTEERLERMKEFRDRKGRV